MSRGASQQSVVYQINERYAPQLAASIESLFNNNQDMDNIVVYVLSQGISKETREALTSIAEKYRREIEFIPVENYLARISQRQTGWDPVVMGRLYMGALLPEKVHRVLYLDADTIVIGSLRELFDVQFDDGIVLAGVIEPTVNKSRLEALGIAGIPYINSGVLFVDLEAWRREGIQEQLIDCYVENRDAIVAPDQDVINMVLKDKKAYLTPDYNYCNTFYYYPYRTLCKILGDTPYCNKDEYEKAISQPKIVHFLGEDRPWRKGNTHRYTGEYKRYLSMTPFAETSDEEGWSGYFFAWRLFNVITRPFPGLRYNIIDSLIPAVLARRAKQE